MALLTGIRRTRTLGFGASCLLHLGLIAALLATERWLLSVDVVRPPVLLAEVVTASDVAPPPEVRSKAEPKRAPPAPAKLPRLLPAPLPRVAEAVTPPPVSKPAASEAPPATTASAPAAASVMAATEPAAVSAPAAPAPGDTGTPSPAPVVASAPARETGSITQSARPQGGYQVRPSYPSSALREGKQGTTMLRVHVLIDGRVGDVIIQQSAGHPDLDQAAVDAVRRWRFDPARRGNEPVAMWVLLPVEFQIR